MKNLKLYFIILSLVFLTGCLQTTALLGPSLTVVSSGNVVQAGLQYGANTAVKNETGKYPLNYIKDTVQEKNNRKNFSQKFRNLMKKRIEIARKKLSIN